MRTALTRADGSSKVGAAAPSSASTDVHSVSNFSKSWKGWSGLMVKLKGGVGLSDAMSDLMVTGGTSNGSPADAGGLASKTAVKRW